MTCSWQLHPLCHSHYSSSQQQWHFALLQAYHIQPKIAVISSQQKMACNTSNNAYQPAQLFLLSTEVVEDTPAGIVGCPSDLTTNQESWAVLVIQIKIMKVAITNNYGWSIHTGKEKCKQKGSFLILWNLNPQKTMGKGIYHWKGKDQIDKIHHQMSNITTKITHRIDSIWLIIYNCDGSTHWPFSFGS